jgi:TPR repeat protein
MITRLLIGVVIAVLVSGNAIAGAFEDCAAANDRQDYTEALRLCRPLAEQGDAEAQNYLGEKYAEGNGVPQDYLEALKWFREEAEQGNPRAQLDLATRCEMGAGVPEDQAEALKWYRKAAEQGYAEAQWSLGMAYERGFLSEQQDSKVLGHSG